MIEGSSNFCRKTEWTLIPCKKKRPLFIALHGFRQSKNDSLEFWSTLIDHTNFLAIDGPYVHEYSHPRKLGHAWYVYDGNREKFSAELATSSLFLDEVIENVKNHIDFDEIWLAGFSQGAYLALYYGLRNLQVSHIQAIGGGLHESLIPESVKNKDLWLHNGKDDPHFSEEKIMILEKTLSARGARVSQRNFNAKHEVSSEMMEELLIALGE